MNPIGSLLAIIPVSYLGGRLAANKPRWIACGMLALGLGSMFNHSQAPNVGFMRKQDDVMIEFTTLRDIAQGEELCMCVPIWMSMQGTILCVPPVLIPDRCVLSACVWSAGRMRSGMELPPMSL